MRRPLVGLLALVALIVGAVVACGGGTSTGASSGTPEPTPTAGTPGGGDCATSECFRAVICRKSDCAGATLNAGCCGCPAGYIDELTCGDAATDSGTDG